MVAHCALRVAQCQTSGLWWRIVRQAGLCQASEPFLTHGYRQKSTVYRAQLIDSTTHARRRGIPIGTANANLAPRCQHTKLNGSPCAAPARRGRNYCVFHDAAHAKRPDDGQPRRHGRRKIAGEGIA
jgi:hypothetical protein